MSRNSRRHFGWHLLHTKSFSLRFRQCRFFSWKEHFRPSLNNNTLCFFYSPRWFFCVWRIWWASIFFYASRLVTIPSWMSSTKSFPLLLIHIFELQTLFWKAHSCSSSLELDLISSDSLDELYAIRVYLFFFERGISEFALGRVDWQPQ